MDHDNTALTARQVPNMPQLRLDVRALEHNVRLMADWCRDQGEDALSKPFQISQEQAAWHVVRGLEKEPAQA